MELPKETKIFKQVVKDSNRHSVRLSFPSIGTASSVNNYHVSKTPTSDLCNTENEKTNKYIDSDGRLKILRPLTSWLNGKGTCIIAPYSAIVAFSAYFFFYGYRK